MNKVLIAVIVGVVIGGIGLVVSNNDNTAETDQTNQTQQSENGDNQQVNEPRANEVFIDNFAFSPENIVVTVGTTVKWTNMDTASHNIDFADDNLEDSRLLAQGESFEYTFNEAGIFEYLCTPHPYMTASVEVVEE